jgi:hypothetical protein
MLDLDRVDEVLGLAKYRKTLMALKVVWWELKDALRAYKRGGISDSCSASHEIGREK